MAGEGSSGAYCYQEKHLYGLSASGKNEEEDSQKVPETVDFKCATCGLSEVCHYYGLKPPFAKRTVEFVEDTFVMLDPFSPREKGKANFLIIGGNCGTCGNVSCVDCSVFYHKRFCRDCAHLHIDQLPTEVQAKLKKLKS